MSVPSLLRGCPWKDPVQEVLTSHKRQVVRILTSFLSKTSSGAYRPIFRVFAS
jgi:hypothetical protein